MAKRAVSSVKEDGSGRSNKTVGSPGSKQAG